MLDWIQQNPALAMMVWGAITAVVSGLFKPRTPEEYDALPPRVAAALKFVSAVGIDVPKAVEAAGQVIMGKKP